MSIEIFINEAEIEELEKSQAEESTLLLVMGSLNNPSKKGLHRLKSTHNQRKILKVFILL